jgi:hypothetical protein
MLIEPADHPAQTLEELSKRYDQLNERKIQSGRDLQHAQDWLKELKQKAKQDYGTDDLEELKKKLEDMKRKNEEDRANYQMSLDNIEVELAEIDKKHNPAEPAND